MAKKTHSKRFETVKGYYDRGIWNKERVYKAVECGWITAAECVEICGSAPETTEE